MARFATSTFEHGINNPLNHQKHHRSAFLLSFLFPFSLARQPTPSWPWLCLLLVTLIHGRGLANEPVSFQLEFRDGTLITAAIEDAPLVWKTVSQSGQIANESIKFSDVRSLSLTTEPASEPMAMILKLVQQLDDDSFSIREAAERELRKTGRRFRSVINQAQQPATLDGRYRLNRIINLIRSGTKEKLIELDRLTLKSGRVLNGDAGQLEINCSYLGSELSIGRQQMLSLQQPVPVAQTRPAGDIQPVRVELFHDLVSFQKSGKHKLLDFEKNGKGIPLSRQENISDSYTGDGIRFGTNFPKGFVGESGYPFNFKDQPPGDNSVCVYKSFAGTQRFLGVMEFTFCAPGKPSIDHGVYEFGCFIATVKRSRDILLEAFDAQGRLLGVCESSNGLCTFCGIKSNVPIAKLTIRSNPWMTELRNRVDQDYAVDNVYFSSPVPIDSSFEKRHFRASNGDYISTSYSRFVGENKLEFNSRHLAMLSVDPVEASSIGIQIPQPKRRPREDWMMLRSDNSTLRWSPQRPFFSTTLQQQVDLKDIVAIWPEKKAMHYPVAGDFTGGKNVLVFPGCRVATNGLVVDKNGYRTKNETVLQESLGESTSKATDGTPLPDDDVVPKNIDYSFDTANQKQFEIPTIWFREPSPISASQGFVRTSTGEILIFGPDSKMQLKSIGSSNFVLAQDGKQLTLPTASVQSIYPPQPTPPTDP